MCIQRGNDTIRAVVEATAAAGANFIYHMPGVTMRDRQRDYFYSKVAAIDPGLPDRYRQLFGDRYVCNSPQARENEKLFQQLCDEHGLLYRMPDIVKGYKREGPVQQRLF